jgi:hypothetical protein
MFLFSVCQHSDQRFTPLQLVVLFGAEHNNKLFVKTWSYRKGTVRQRTDPMAVPAYSGYTSLARRTT